jgi:hypothetical protein
MYPIILRPTLVVKRYETLMCDRTAAYSILPNKAFLAYVMELRLHDLG